MLKAGATLGSYEIVTAVAAGGMGVVYRAKHMVLGKEVALKVLLPAYALKEKVRTRFKQEAYVQAQLVHDNIVHVSDIVEDGQTLAIVMEFINGPSLETVLEDERTEAWPIEDAVAVMTPVLDVMAFAHQSGVVHRDVKPGNILLSRLPGSKWPGVPKVTDFGLAKILSTEFALTQDGARMGTVPYMSPEQFKGLGELDARTDVFGLGLLFWRLLAGRLPINPNDMTQVLELYKGTITVPKISTIVAGLPDAVSVTIDAATRFDRDERPRDAGAMLAIIKSENGGAGFRPAGSRPSTPPPPPPVSRHPSSPSMRTHLPPPPPPVSRHPSSPSMRTHLPPPPPPPGSRHPSTPPPPPPNPGRCNRCGQAAPNAKICPVRHRICASCMHQCPYCRGPVCTLCEVRFCTTCCKPV
jgi:serine/threonine protein kinase